MFRTLFAFGAVATLFASHAQPALADNPYGGIAVYFAEDAYEACFDAWANDPSVDSYAARVQAKRGLDDARHAFNEDLGASWRAARIHFEDAACHALLAFIEDGNPLALDAYYAAADAERYCFQAYLRSGRFNLFRY
jgi:hypothetical protein